MDPLDGSYIKVSKQPSAAKLTRASQNLMPPPSSSSTNQRLSGGGSGGGLGDSSIVSRTLLLSSNSNLKSSIRQTSTPSGLAQNNCFPNFHSPNDYTTAAATQSATTASNLSNRLSSVPAIVISTSNVPQLNDKENQNIISYQRVIKNIVVNDISDAEIKLKEEYVSRLKSIDLNQFSFPNEMKPRTDYTYART